MLIGERDAPNGKVREGVATALSRLRRDDRGMTIVLVAIAASALIGFTGLAVETGLWYTVKRVNQSAADTAALSGAFEVLAGQPYEDICGFARRDAIRNGYTFSGGWSCPAITPACTSPPSSGGMCVNNPPMQGLYTGNNNAVEVILAQQQNALLASIDLANVTITTRAVAILKTSFNACILGLDKTAPSTVNVFNNAALSNPNCGVASNSKASPSLTVDNNASIAGPVSVVGGEAVTNGSTITGRPNLIGAPPVPDPYAGVALQTIPDCTTTQTGTWIDHKTTTLNPDHFCDGFHFENTVVIHLNPGRYYVDNHLIIQDNVMVDTPMGGVTLIINGTYSFDITNKVTLNITAPTTGPYAGLAFFGSRSGSSSTPPIFDNNTTLHVTGASYFPS